MKPLSSIALALTLFFISALLTEVLYAKTLNGFNLNHTLLSSDKILSGGPGRDGIPAIDTPHFISAKQASFLKPSDRLLGIVFNGVVKAYPIRILNWHEIVNDTFKGTSVAITYCPLCGTGIAFKSPSIKGFGVSGLLYNSDVLLYDRHTESLWSQILMKAVSGPMKGQSLTPIALEHTTWEDWQKRHPLTQVLSIKTGFNRDYERDPYLGYASSRRLYFPVNNTDNRYHPKEWVIGIEINGQYKAYPFSELIKNHTNPIKDNFQDTSLHIYFNRQHHSATVTDEHHNLLPTLQAFWFAWTAFHPETAVYSAL